MVISSQIYGRPAALGIAVRLGHHKLLLCEEQEHHTTA